MIVFVGTPSSDGCPKAVNPVVAAASNTAVIKPAAKFRKNLMLSPVPIAARVSGIST
jgi:hypothetical protein